jgi:hypothetical protein
MSIGDLSTRVEYRQIARFPGYRFGDDGSVWSCWKKVGVKGAGRRGVVGVIGTEWRRMALDIGIAGYPFLRIKDPARGKQVGYNVHSLVLEAFEGPRPLGKECRHLDGNPANSRLDNLEWATPKVNNGDKKRHGTDNAGERHYLAKLTWAKVAEIRRLSDEGVSQAALSRQFDTNARTINDVVRGRTWAGPPPA